MSWLLVVSTGCSQIPFFEQEAEAPPPPPPVAEPEPAPAPAPAQPVAQFANLAADHRVQRVALDRVGDRFDDAAEHAVQCGELDDLGAHLRIGDRGQGGPVQSLHRSPPAKPHEQPMRKTQISLAGRQDAWHAPDSSERYPVPS